MWPCVWQQTPKTANVTVAKIAVYVRVRIINIRWFFSYLVIYSCYATATLLNMSLSHVMNMWLTDAADGGCGGELDFAPMHAIRCVGQCDVNSQSLSPRGSRSKTVANDYRHGCGLWTLVGLITKYRGRSYLAVVNKHGLGHSWAPCQPSAKMLFMVSHLL